MIGQTSHIITIIDNTRTIEDIIHWSCYSVNYYDVIHFCMWSFWVETNLSSFFYCLFISVLPLEIQLSRKAGLESL